MIDIISRQQWGARQPRRRSTIRTPSPQLWLHHSAGSERGASGVRQIQDLHMDDNRWNDIAYSFVIDRDSLEVFEGRGAGVLGGHTSGRNAVSHGICVMGNFENAAVSDGLIDTVAALIRHGHGEGWWPAKLSGGHRDVKATACPGINLYQQIGEINRRALNAPTNGNPGGGTGGGPLGRGAAGVAVARFQNALLAWNADALPEFGADGDYGEETEVWVRNFQTALDLPASGSIDGVTAALLLQPEPQVQPQPEAGEPPPD